MYLFSSSATYAFHYLTGNYFLTLAKILGKHNDNHFLFTEDILRGQFVEFLLAFVK